VSTVPVTVHAFPSLEPTALDHHPLAHLHLPLRRDLLHAAVVYEGSHTRQGTASSKTRFDVHGSHRKVRPQKGTGRARQGSIRAPQYVGGGVVHGPTPRDYSQRTPKKMKAAALRGALSDRARDGRIHVVTELVSGVAPSTKGVVKALDALALDGGLLIVVSREEGATWMSLRNLPEVHVLAPDQLNTYDVLVSDHVIFTSAALTAFLAGPVKGKSVKSVATESEVAE